MHAVVLLMDWAFLFFFLGLNGTYLLLLALSLREVLRRNRRGVEADVDKALLSPFAPPVSILAPAYNEELTIVGSLRSLLSLRYRQFEVVVVNDGSKDRTIGVLVDAFELFEVHAAYEPLIATQPIKALYRSRLDPRLTVVDKANGGKADALNCGINLARYDLVCGIDADTLILPDALTRIALPFVEDPERTVASGGTIRVANGCTIEGGEVRNVALPKNRVAALQVVEYLRAFLLGRAGFDAIDGTLIISGAFGLFHRPTAIACGGYRHDTVGEDMELVVRMHRMMRELGKPYRVAFVWDAACYTEVPEDLGVLKRQRNRWHRGLIDSLLRHRVMFLNRRYGVIGLFVVPFFAIFEMLGPVIELLGFVAVLVSFATGLVDGWFMTLFLFAALALGVAVSMGAVLLEELSYAAYPRWGELGRMLWLAILENLGYRQLTVWWRVRAFYDYMRGNQQWGAMVRKGFATPSS